MRYHYDKPTVCSQLYGQLYICYHPVYNRSLYQENDGKPVLIEELFEYAIFTNAIMKGGDSYDKR